MTRPNEIKTIDEVDEENVLEGEKKRKTIIIITGYRANVVRKIKIRFLFIKSSLICRHLFPNGE